MEIKYKIVILKSCLGNFTWHLMTRGGNNSFRKIAEAPQMYSKKHCMNAAVNGLSKALNCPIELFDLSQDYEE